MITLPSEFALETLTITPERLIAVITAQSPFALCTVCHHSAERIHSRYIRCIADVAWGEYCVQLQWHIRKFFCANPTCPRLIFSEQYPEFVAPSSRITQRLVHQLQAIAVACGGRSGSRLTVPLHIPTLPKTLLRRLLERPLPTTPPVRRLGVDDWAWKKGKRYGTILIDHDRKAIIDILPERSTKSFAAWLREHPTVRVITRDRGSIYAKAATLAAPQAQQVADRFHLVQNLVEMLKILLARCRKEIRTAHGDEDRIAPKEALPTLPVPGQWRPQNPYQAQQAAHAREASRQDQYHQIVALRSQGLSWEAVAQQLEMNPKTIRRWIAHEGPPPHASHGQRRYSVFDPFAALILEQWQSGNQNGHHLYELIVTRGYRGTERTVQRFLQALRRHRKPVLLRPSSLLDAFDPRKIAWLYITQPETLTQEQHLLLTAITDKVGVAKQGYLFAQQFMAMIHTHRSPLLPLWLHALDLSAIPEFKRFADGIRRDWDAVSAALNSSGNNGRTEGMVNRLKMVKRSMYGRAGLPLLRQRLIVA